MSNKRMIHDLNVHSFFLNEYYNYYNHTIVANDRKIELIEFRTFMHYDKDFNTSLEFNRIIYEILLAIGYDDIILRESEIYMEEIIEYEVLNNTFYEKESGERIIDDMIDNTHVYSAEIAKHSLTGGIVVKWLTGLKCFLITNRYY